jgi:hypothetical protein
MDTGPRIFGHHHRSHSEPDMKCPHCNTGIHRQMATTILIKHEPRYSGAKGLDGSVRWDLTHMQCPECHEDILVIRRVGPEPEVYFTAYPTQGSRPIPAEVTSPYREDFAEACKVLNLSPKASAALSRRLLQAILRDKASTKSKDLNDQIEEVLASGKLPSHISGGLHAVRNIGNFAAHTMKSTATGVILDVEPGEAEWNLDVVESLFDFYFVAPATDAKRKADLNAKLKAAGKPEIP